MSAATPAPPERFELSIEVRTDDIDAQGHVNNVVFLRWVQDVAVAHWRARTTPEEVAEVAWVVVRHEIDYHRPARLGEAILARTWVGVASRRSFERHTEIVRVADGERLATARTVWVPLDPRTGRVAQVSDGVRRKFSVPAAPRAK